MIEIFFLYNNSRVQVEETASRDVTEYSEVLVKGGIKKQGAVSRMNGLAIFFHD